MAANLRTNSGKWQQSSQQAYTLVLARDDFVSNGVVVDGGNRQLDQLYRKLTWRLMPLFMLMLGLNYLDRTSLAFASIQMTQELHFTPEVYGVASGLFFLSYCLMQIPANFVCMHLGVQKWFSGMLFVWGITAAAFAAVKTPWQFYLLRLLLGVAEAGSFPGVWYAITLWFPPDRLAFPYALTTASVAISQVVAAPLAAALLKLDGTLGLSGWQWVFLGEGFPSVVLALCMPVLLPDGPDDIMQQGFVGMLSTDELSLLQADHLRKLQSPHGKLHYNEASGSDTHDKSTKPGGARGWKLLLQVARVWQIWYLAMCNIFKDIGNLALMMWLPVMVHALLSGGDPTQIASQQHSIGSSTTGASGETVHESQPPTADTGVVAVLLSAIPFTTAALAVVLSGILAQRTGRPLLFIIIPNFIAGISFICFHWVVHWSRVAGFLCLIVTLSCAYAASPHAPTIIAKLTAGRAAAVAMPCFNSVAMLGGFVGPTVMGVMVQHMGSFGIATAAMGGSMLLAGGMALILQCL